MLRRTASSLLRSLHHAHRRTLALPLSATPRLAPVRTMATSGSYTTTPLTRIVWGPGSLTQLPELLDALPQVSGSKGSDGPRRALILTGNSLASKTDVIRRAEQALGARHAATFTGIGEHAPVEGIKEAVRLMEQHGATALVAIGGGSPIDAAKAVSFYIHRESAHADNDDERTFVPIIAVPTTLSAAETTQNAGFKENNKKTGVSHRALVPRVLLLDGDITRHTPERLWLSTGMRAVDHSIELLYRPDVSPLLRGTWLMAMRELFTLLPLSKAQPDNIDVRQRLQLAAIASLWPESRKGALGLSHGLGHALGATYKIGHGITSCLTLGPAIQLTAALPSTGAEQLLALADARAFIPAPFATPVPIGATPSAQLQGKPDLDAARKQGKEVGEAVQKLVDELGLHSRLEPLGVPHEDLPTIAAHVAGDDKEKAAAVTELLEKIFK